MGYISKLASNKNNPAYESLFSKIDNKVLIKNTTPLQIYIHEVLNKTGATFQQVEENRNLKPPWKTKSAKFDLSLNKFSKNNTGRELYYQNYREYLDRKRNEFIIYTDGSVNLNGTGCGIVLPEATYKYHLPNNSSIATAEMFAIKKAVEHGTEVTRKKLTICTDSLPTILKLQRLYPKDRLTAETRLTIHNYIRTQNKSVTIMWVPSHQGIEGNEAAKTSTQEPTLDTTLTSADTKRYYKNKIIELHEKNWQELQNNKLRSIKPTTRPWSTPPNRRHQTIMTRLRIGHSSLTHRHILDNRGPPQCPECLVTFDVDHFMTKCRFLAPLRRKYGIPNTMEEALLPNNSGNIIDFLLEAGLYRHI